MKKVLLLLIFAVINSNLSLAQSKSKLNHLLNEIAKTENSKTITKTKEAKKVISFGKKALPILAEFFTDSALTKVKSECQARNLTKGELAIIMADRIERMPYAKLTGIQNCIMTFCENNPNFIEYYLWAIKRDGVEAFKGKYLAWLESEDRIEWTSIFD